MPTQTLTKQSAQILLADAQQQHSQLARKFSELQTRLATLEPGTDAFTSEAHRAADMKAALQNLTVRIQELELQATTEEERKAKAEQEAQVEAARAALEAAAEQDLAQAEKLIETINSHSDALATAIAELANLEGWNRLRQTGKLTFTSRDRSPRAMASVMPYVQRFENAVVLQRRAECNL